MVMLTEVVSLMEREWSCYGCGQFYGGRSHFTEVLTLMDICIFYCILWSNRWCFVSCIQYILPLNLLIFLFINVFLKYLVSCILHTAKFLHTGEREDFMPAKNRASMSKQRRGMTFSPMFGKACQHVILSPLNDTEVVSSI